MARLIDRYGSKSRGILYHKRWDLLVEYNYSRCAYHLTLVTSGAESIGRNKVDRGTGAWCHDDIHRSFWRNIPSATYLESFVCDLSRTLTVQHLPRSTVEWVWNNVIQMLNVYEEIYVYVKKGVQYARVDPEICYYRVSLFSTYISAVSSIDLGTDRCLHKLKDRNVKWKTPRWERLCLLLFYISGPTWLQYITAVNRSNFR